MARIRTVKPEMWQDEKLAPLTPIDRLVFLGLISMADDDGRLVDNIKLIDGFIFPSTDDSSRGSIETLARLGRVLRYTTASGQALLQISNWSKHQRVDNHAKYTLPAPTAEDVAAQEVRNSKREPREKRASVSRSDPRPTTFDPRPTTLASGDAEGVPDVPDLTPSDQPAVDDDPLPTTSTSWVAEFGDVYKAVHGGLPNYGKLGKHLKPAVDTFGRERALSAWRRFCASANVRFGPAHFVEHFGSYEPQIIGAGGDEAAILAWMAEDRT